MARMYADEDFPLGAVLILRNRGVSAHHDHPVRAGLPPRSLPAFSPTAGAAALLAVGAVPALGGAISANRFGMCLLPHVRAHRFVVG